MAYRKQNADEARISLMRAALTRSTSKLTISGRERAYGGPKPITLAPVKAMERPEKK